jgi:hypothetical protein
MFQALGIDPILPRWLHYGPIIGREVRLTQDDATPQFPLGLRLVGQFSDGDRHVALAWAVNGLLTVVGSVVTVALAMLVGFSTVLLVGVAAYTIAALFIFVVSR